MGNTNTSVVEHICSKCRCRRPIYDFPYPKEVWWCHACWRVFRTKQNDERRKRREEALERDLRRPPSNGRAFNGRRSKGGMAALSPAERQLAQQELNRLVARCKAEGRPLTQQKIASLTANAIFIVRHVRTGRVLGWMGNYWKRLKRRKRLQERRQLDEFKAKPIWQRCKLLHIG
jgi:hypothetical protein